MPAKDRFHGTVVRALIKDGWSIRREQVFVKLPERRLWIDIEAVKAEISVVVEVKSYSHVPSPVETLAASIGKYVIYRSAMDRLKDNRTLYMAIPEHAHKGIFGETLGQLVIQRVNISLLVYDERKEEIIGWIP